MKELANILELWGHAQSSLETAVLATVVRVKGSAYRRPGARMLLCSDGTRIGSVSGGCLEGDLAKKAWWLTEGDVPVIRTYDTTSDDDTVQVFGLGCNGVIDVLLERAATRGVQQTMLFLEECQRNNAPGVIATVIRADQNSRWRTGDRLFRGSSAGSLSSEDVRKECEQAFRERTSRVLHLSDCDLFVEYVPPTQRLVIFGGGHDAIPLASMASVLGWHVTVVDGKAPNLRPGRFPTANSLVCLSPQNPLQGIEEIGEAAVVLMTHSYSLDRELLRDLLPREPKYIGVLGPRDRTRRLFGELGIPPELHSPAGLDIGADSPELIALAILAEVQAVLSGRPGGMLMQKTGPIYEPVREVSLPAAAIA